MTGEEIVISGISGVFPNSENVLEFSANLYNRVDMVSDKPRWSSNDPELPKHSGKISNIEKFDSQFFKVAYQYANALEPLTRKLLENAYGAIFDSGNTHASLKGIKIGVFTGISFADFSTLCMYDLKNRSGLITCGSNKANAANRISFWIDSNGPSYNLDFSCASSAAALVKAFESIRSGDCDAAIVGSGNIVSHPMVSLNMKKAGLLCMDGKTKCFDKNANGYVRSDAASVIFLQKAKHAKRIYAEIYHGKGLFNMKSDAQLVPFCKSEDIQKCLTNFYSEINIGPEVIEYVEANGAAIAYADENELDAIGKVFANNKTIKVGSVKSNMGHSDAVSGLTSVTKLCLAYQKGEIAANLHYKEPHDVTAIRDGKVQILTENSKFNRTYVALNNFSYSGANYHIVLKGHYKEKDLDKYRCQIPRIILASGRNESCVSKIMDSLKSKPMDAEEIALLHSIFKNDIITHTGRGYTILDTTDQGKTAVISENIGLYSGTRKPLWFVFSGMGSQWIGMGADLMRIPTFARAIERCHKVLEPKGIDIVKIISEPDEKIFIENFLNAFVGINVIQIGLTDILIELGVEPDYIIGHSLGELACAYYDNTLTLEECVLATYCRGQAVSETKPIKGSMAAVGLGYKSLVKLCPSEIDIACHNSFESSTISGPFDIMEGFVDELVKSGIFAKKVETSDIAYHSRYVADTGPTLIHHLHEVIKEPILRSEKWLSTSVPREQWGEESAKYSSAEYYANNMINPVFFEEVISLIPSNAVVVEIAPHGLLQAILRRSHPECTHISLTRRGCQDGVAFLLEGIGKLYLAGYNPKVDVLYPKVDFPVSTETPLLSHLVEWEHSETWPTLQYSDGVKIISPSRDLIISIHDDDYSYIADHVINGVPTIPEAALLVYVWETLAMYKGVHYLNLSVVFKDIYFHSDVTVNTEAAVKLSIMIGKGSDNFEICQDSKLLVSGNVSGARKITFNHSIDSSEEDFDDIWLNSEEVYKKLSMRGYCYNGALKSINKINTHRNTAYVKWINDWIPFLDSLIQLNTITRNYNGISRPTFIRNITVSVFEQEISKPLPIGEEKCHVAQLDKTLGITRCAGVEIDTIIYEDKPVVCMEPNVLRNRSFFPYFTTEEVDIKTAVEINIQVMSENVNLKHIHIKISTALNKFEVLKHIQKISDCLPDVTINLKSVNFNTDFNHLELKTNQTNVLVVENMLQDSKKIKNCFNVISEEDFILTFENQIPSHSDIKKHFSVLTCMSNEKQTVILLRKKYHCSNIFCYPVTMEHKFSWILRVSGELMTTKHVVLISERQPHSGLLGYVRKIKKDGYKNISFISILDFHAQPFDSENEFYKEQLEKNLCVNVLKKGQFGGYYYTSCFRSTNLRSFTLKNYVPGDIEKLSWEEAPPCLAMNTLVQVSFSGLTRKDFENATYDFKSNNKLFGMDFSGIDKNGDRVMGLISGGAMSSTVEADPDLLWPVPDHWSLEDAATVPLPYVMAYYCLVLKRDILLSGQRVLIIDGAGAFGQAMISLCLARDCTVFTTVSEMENKKLLMKLFPQINEYNISFTDPDSLYNMVMRNTETEGCHLVINCATGTGILSKTGLKCMKTFGHFLDLSKNYKFENDSFGLSLIKGGRSIRAVDLLNIFRPEYAYDKIILQQCLADGIARGIVKPLTRVVYSPQFVSRAFRLLSQGKPTGRALMRLRDPTIMNQGLNVRPRLIYAVQDVVVIVCDKRHLGVELADKIVERGATKVIINMASDIISGYEHAKFLSWSKSQIAVKICSENLHTQEGCTSFMRNAMKFGKVKEIYIIQDGKPAYIANIDDFTKTYDNKCSVVLNLDTASRNCAELRYFTIVAHSIQNASEEYALSLSERVCELRKESGLPALVIRCEALAEIESNGFDYSYRKVKPQSLSTFFNALEISLKMKYNNVLTFNSKKKTKSDSQNKIAEILGVTNIQDLENETMIHDFNLNEIVLKELQYTINNICDIHYPIEKIDGMSIICLKDLINKHCPKHTDFNSGMATFYKKVSNEEEYIYDEPVIELPTLLNNNNEKNIAPNDTYLIMIPGFEGRAEVFKAAAVRLKIKAVGVQLGPDIKGDSFREIAETIRKTLKTKLNIKSKFYIMGYSFGVNVALELAAIFEEEGQNGVVFCLDSSPEALPVHIDAYLGTILEPALQDIVLRHMTNLITESKAENIQIDFDQTDTFEEKVETCLKKLKGIVPYSEQYKKQILESVYKRIKTAKEYKPDIRLKSELVLLKGISHPNTNNLNEDYTLSKYSIKPVKIFNLGTHHGLVYQDCRVSNIINKFLDRNIQDEYRKKNLCNVYYTEP